MYVHEDKDIIQNKIVQKYNMQTNLLKNWGMVESHKMCLSDHLRLKRKFRNRDNTIFYYE